MERTDEAAGPGGGSPEPLGTPTSRQRSGPARLAGYGGDVLQIVGLCGMAIVQPLLSTLGPNPTYFVAHDLSGSQILLFVAAVVLVPVGVFSAIVLTARLISPRWSPAVGAAVKGVLAAAAVVSLFGLASRLPTALYVVVATLLAVGLGVVFARESAIRTFAAALSPMTLVFVGLFVFSSASGELIGASDPDAVVASTSSGTSVYTLILDELPTAAIMNPAGDIDADRFPGFARLADTSTWYRQATTVDPWTHFAVPAIMSGEIVTETRAPIAGQYPRSIFTMLGGSRTMNVHEDVTQLCPESLCGEGDARPPAALAKDTSILVGYPLLPESVAKDWYPAVGNQWSDFDSLDAPSEGTELDIAAFEDQQKLDGERPEYGSESIRVFDEFLATIRDETDPTLALTHLLVPHAPLVFLPDGRRYAGHELPGLSDNIEWDDDADLTAVAMQRFELQVAYVDTLIDRLLDTLEETGKLDDSIVVVVADHGVSFEPGGQRRPLLLTERNRHEALPVPLFVKYPGQAEGSVDDRLASTVDIVPTVADQLDLSLPDDWDFDGESLLQPSTRETRAVLGFRLEDFDPAMLDDVDPLEAQAHYLEWLGSRWDEHDLYRVGPHGDLVGTTVGPLESLAGATVVLDDLADIAAGLDVSGEVPALVDVQVSGLQNEAWAAVILDGIVAGVGPVYGTDDDLRITAMVDPSLLVTTGADVEIAALVDGELRVLAPA